MACLRISFGGTIPPPQNVGTDVTVLGQSLLLALLFLLLAAFPSQLFNKTLEENYTEVPVGSDAVAASPRGHRRPGCFLAAA